MPDSIVQGWPANGWHQIVGTAAGLAVPAMAESCVGGQLDSVVFVLQDYGAVMARQQAQQRPVQRETAGASADAGY